MDDPYWQVRVKSARSLGLLRAAEAIPVLAPALTHDISNLRKDAAAALGEIAHSDAIPFLEAAAGDPDPDVRKNVDWALRRIRAA
jgi:HEAT repeat protein